MTKIQLKDILDELGMEASDTYSEASVNQILNHAIARVLGDAADIMDKRWPVVEAKIVAQMLFLEAAGYKLESLKYGE